MDLTFIWKYLSLSAEIGNENGQGQRRAFYQTASAFEVRPTDTQTSWLLPLRPHNTESSHVKRVLDLTWATAKQASISPVRAAANNC